MFPFRILLVRHMLTFIRVSRYMFALLGCVNLLAYNAVSHSFGQTHVNIYSCIKIYVCPSWLC